jgi:hypothetical protein
MRVNSLEIAVMAMAPKLGRMEVTTLEIGKMIKKRWKRDSNFG